jgi:hypothetical protein
MEYGSNAVGAAAAAKAAVQRKERGHFRQKIHTLAYVNLDHANGGIIRDLSEAGFAIQAVAPLRANQKIHLRFELLNPRIRVEATGRVAWADPMGQAGVEFLDLPERSRGQLKEWLFIQLLSAAHQISWESIFVHNKRGEQATELLFSAAARPAICLEPPEAAPQTPEISSSPRQTPHRLWWPVPLSPRSLARIVDGLLLVSAVLLFSVVSLTMTHLLPAWPVALGLALVLTGLFAVLYWFLFTVWIDCTPGSYLAQLASDSEDGTDPEEEDRPRFR